jgi:hypothetical protein
MMILLDPGHDHLIVRRNADVHRPRRLVPRLGDRVVERRCPEHKVVPRQVFRVDRWQLDDLLEIFLGLVELRLPPLKAARLWHCRRAAHAVVAHGGGARGRGLHVARRSGGRARQGRGRLREVEHRSGALDDQRGGVVRARRHLGRREGAEPDAGLLARLAYLGHPLPPRPHPHAAVRPVPPAAAAIPVPAPASLLYAPDQRRRRWAGDIVVRHCQWQKIARKTRAGATQMLRNGSCLGDGCLLKEKREGFSSGWRMRIDVDGLTNAPLSYSTLIRTSLENRCVARFAMTCDAVYARLRWSLTSSFLMNWWCSYWVDLNTDSWLERVLDTSPQNIVIRGHLLYSRVVGSIADAYKKLMNQGLQSTVTPQWPLQYLYSGGYSINLIQ